MMWRIQFITHGRPFPSPAMVMFETQREAVENAHRIVKTIQSHNKIRTLRARVFKEQ